MSKKNRFYSNYRQETEGKDLVTSDENFQEEVIENEETTESLVTEEVVSEEKDMLLDKSEVESVIEERIETIIEKNSQELKEKIEVIHSSLVSQELKEEKKEFVVDMKDYVSTTLLSYYENMNAKKPVSNDDAARWNYSLYNLFMEVLNKPLEEFKKDWKTILKFFDQYASDCFNHGMLYRAPFSWPGTDKEFSIYKTLAFICVETAKPETRSQAVKEMKNLENRLSDLSEEQKSKLISFYF